MLCFCFVFLRLVAIFSGLSIFYCPSVFYNVYQYFILIINIKWLYVVLCAAFTRRKKVPNNTSGTCKRWRWNWTTGLNEDGQPIQSRKTRPVKPECISGKSQNVKWVSGYELISVVLWSNTNYYCCSSSYSCPCWYFWQYYQMLFCWRNTKPQ